MSHCRDCATPELRVIAVRIMQPVAQHYVGLTLPKKPVDRTHASRLGYVDYMVVPALFDPQDFVPQNSSGFVRGLFAARRSRRDFGRGREERDVDADPVTYQERDDSANHKLGIIRVGANYQSALHICESAPFPSHDYAFVPALPCENAANLEMGGLLERRFSPKELFLSVRGYG
jgi:hypothetical protein